MGNPTIFWTASDLDSDDEYYVDSDDEYYVDSDDDY